MRNRWKLWVAGIALVQLLVIGVDVALQWPTRSEAAETAWLLGAPFFVQIIEGAGDSWAQVVAGSVEASGEAERVLDARWRRTVVRPADVVLASVSGARS